MANLILREPIMDCKRQIRAIKQGKGATAWDVNDLNNWAAMLDELEAAQKLVGLLIQTAPWPTQD